MAGEVTLIPTCPLHHSLPSSSPPYHLPPLYLLLLSYHLPPLPYYPLLPSFSPLNLSSSFPIFSIPYPIIFPLYLPSLFLHPIIFPLSHHLPSISPTPYRHLPLSTHTTIASHHHHPHTRTSSTPPPYHPPHLQTLEEPERALVVLRKALKKDRGNTLLYHHVFDICYQRQPIDIQGVLASTQLALAAKDLSLSDKSWFAYKRQEFLREHGSILE